MPKILIVEDEENIRSFIKVNLKRHGYTAVEAGSGEDGLKLAHLHPDISIALLDVMLPGINGFEVCHSLRAKHPLLGIIMLTAKGQEVDIIEGLGGGADDYIVKPFSPTELMARIEALLRRINLKTGEKAMLTPVLTVSPFKFNPAERKFYKHEVEISLTPTELAIIELFMSNANNALSRDVILDKVWGENYVGDYKVVDVNMRRLRSKIEDNPVEPQYIESVWGYGYRFQGDSVALRGEHDD